jgi:hypothetical protein
MARVEIDYVWQSVTGQAIDGGAVYVYTRGTTTPITIYSAATGGGTLTQPLTTTDGRIAGWVDPGSYDLVASKTGFNTVTQPWEATVYTPPPAPPDLSPYAPLASPSFSGTVGLPTYVLTSRPAATVGAGKAIYVTDADIGSRFQVSDGSVWKDYSPGSVGAPNVQTASYTLTIADFGKAVEMNAAGATVITVPPNSSVAFPIGTVVEVGRYGAGTVTVAAGAGVTVRSAGGKVALASQYSNASLRKRATDEWWLSGDLA